MKRSNSNTTKKKPSWHGRSLANYKAIHKEGPNGDALQLATTLTEAKKIRAGVSKSKRTSK